MIRSHPKLREPEVPTSDHRLPAFGPQDHWLRHVAPGFKEVRVDLRQCINLHVTSPGSLEPSTSVISCDIQFTHSAINSYTGISVLNCPLFRPDTRHS